MPASGYVTPTLKTKPVDLLRNLAFTEENSLSKQLRIVCEFYIESKKIEIQSKPLKEIMSCQT